MNTELPPMPKGDAMSQAEVERLLVATAESASTADAIPALPEAGPDPQSPPKAEFPKMSAFSPIHLRSLRAHHDEYIRALGARLSGQLRLECGLSLTRMETARSKPFMQGLPEPTHLVLFQLDPPGKVCLLEVPPRLGLCMVDRELGGPGVFPDELRELTKMEIKLLSRLVDIFTTEWCAAWRDAVELRPTQLKHETCAQFVKVHAPDELLLLLGIEVRIGDLVEQVQLALPVSVVEPLLLKLEPESDGGKQGGPARPAAPSQWSPRLNNIELRVSAEWFGLEMTAGKLAELKPGDVLPVSAATAGRVQVLVDSAPKFLGELGKCGQQWAVKISGKLVG